MTTARNFLRAAAAIAVLVMAGCTSNRPAPVVETRPTAPVGKPVAVTSSTTPAAPAEAPKPSLGDKVHVIQKGDTLISIALANGLDYRELAMWNNIDNPNVIKLGEPLRLTAPGAPAATPAASPADTPIAQPKPGEPVTAPLIITPMPTVAGPSGNTDKLKTEPRAGKVPYSDAAYAKLSAEAASAAAAGTPPVVATAPATPVATPASPANGTAAAPRSDDVDWAWPIQPPPKGKILSTFTEASKGIDISGAKDSPVLASGPGKVVYAAAGLRGYGRLVIIKHNDTWLSAYAHNEKLLVSEGQEVKKGQKIAEMGSSDTDQVKLHFEIRKQGKPVDPMLFLPK